jgi:hypothetical protein
MQEREVKIVELKYAAIIVGDIVGIAKLTQPATLQTLEVPYIQVQLRATQPLLIPYDSEEDRDADYDLIKTELGTW